jgi:hypothetical protein
VPWPRSSVHRETRIRCGPGWNRAELPHMGCESLHNPEGNTCPLGVTIMSIQSPSALDRLEPDKCCNDCGKPKPDNSPPFQVCSACKTATYCSKLCQRRSWKKHKACKVPLSDVISCQMTRHLKVICKENAAGLEKLAIEPDAEPMMRLLADLRYW